MSAGGADAADGPARLGAGFWLFIALMAALTALFAALGIWQLNRLAEKEALIATVAERFAQPPVAFPSLGEWTGLDPAAFDYRPVRLRGHFLEADAVRVFTALSQPKGTFDGPGYWVMAPFALEGGGIAFVNRGFVPEPRAAAAPPPAGPENEVELEGIARKPEAAGAFTPAPDTARRIDWVRDPARLAAFLAPGAAPVAPLYVDLPAGPPGALPQGGETVVAFPNNHFGYALTWFGFALLTPALLAVWIVRQLRARRPGDAPKGSAG